MFWIIVSAAVAGFVAFSVAGFRSGRIRNMEAARKRSAYFGHLLQLALTVVYFFVLFKTDLLLKIDSMVMGLVFAGALSLVFGLISLLCRENNFIFGWVFLAVIAVVTSIFLVFVVASSAIGSGVVNMIARILMTFLVAILLLLPAIPGIFLMYKAVDIADKREGKRADKADAAKEAPASDFEYDIDGAGDGVIIKNYHGSKNVVNVPARIEGFPVKEVIFNGMGTSIILPAGVTKFSLYNCANDTTVALPDSVTEVSFSNCVRLKSLALPSGVSSVHFWECKALESLTLPDGVTSCSFRGCTSLRSITLPDGITEIGYGAFEGCTSLTAITLPKNLQRFDRYEKKSNAFKGCSSLKTVTFQGDIEEIPEDTFDGCTALETLNINGNIGSIGYHTTLYGHYGAFSDCHNLATVNVGPKVTKIGNVDAIIHAGDHDVSFSDEVRGNKLSLAPKAALAKFREGGA